MDPFDYINDPIAVEQMVTLRRLLGDEWTDTARDGFLVVAGRFIDDTSTDRTDELHALFDTDNPAGRPHAFLISVELATLRIAATVVFLICIVRHLIQE